MWHLNTLKEKKTPLPWAYTLPAFTVPFKRCNLTISDHREETVTANDDELKITWERRFSGHSVAARPQRNNWGSHGKLPQTKQNNHVYCWRRGGNKQKNNRGTMYAVCLKGQCAARGTTVFSDSLTLLPNSVFFLFSPPSSTAAHSRKEKTCFRRCQAINIVMRAVVLRRDILRAQQHKSNDYYPRAL